MFAWTVEGFLDKKTKFDPRYVKGFARMTGLKHGERFENLLEYHECTTEELKKFPTPAKGSEFLMEYYLKEENKLFCVDQERYRDILAIWGDYSDQSSYQFFEFNLVPCNYVHTQVRDTGDFVAKDCIADH